MEQMNQEYASNVDFDTVADANHWLCEENPSFVVDRITQFLTEHKIYQPLANGKTIVNGR